MFIVTNVLLFSSATAIVLAGESIWLNPFTTVLFNVCSAVTIECCILYMYYEIKHYGSNSHTVL